MAPTPRRRPHAANARRARRASPSRLRAERGWQNFFGDSAVAWAYIGNTPVVGPGETWKLTLSTCTQPGLPDNPTPLDTDLSVWVGHYCHDHVEVLSTLSSA